MPPRRKLLTVLAVAVWIGAAAAAARAAPAGGAAAALERYAPVLRYDSAETHFAQPVTRGGEVIGEDVAYGHVAREDGETWLQYWLFYAYNSQDRGVLRTGRHEGDWEFLQLRLGPGGRPDAATFAQHSWAEACAYSDVETEDRDGAAVPVVYVANGSHASYPRAGTADRPWPDPNDEADGGGRTARPLVRRSATARPHGCATRDRGDQPRPAWCPGSSRARRARATSPSSSGSVPRRSTRRAGRAGLDHPAANG